MEKEKIRHNELPASQTLWEQTRAHILFCLADPVSPYRTLTDIRVAFHLDCGQRIAEVGEKQACIEWIERYYPEWWLHEYKTDALEAAADIVLESKPCP